MQPELSLQNVIDRCYDVFEHYKRPSILDASPLRNAKEILSDITSTPLRDLPWSLLGPYAGYALTTVGNVKNYKHFLPRILEQSVICADHLGFSPEIIADKLILGEWKTWSSAEQTVISEMFFEAWEQAVGESDDDVDASAWLCGIARLDLDLPGALQAWIHEPSSNAVLQLSSFICVGGETIFETNKTDRVYWGEVNEDSIKLMRDWILDASVSHQIRLARQKIPSDDHWKIDRALLCLDGLKTL